MSVILRGVKAVYHFLIGDMRLLIGTMLTLLLTALLAPQAPKAMGVLLVVLLALTLSASLRHEIAP